MRTKRYTALLLAAALALSLAGCGMMDRDKKKKDEDGGMTIQPAQLTEEEEALAQLLALGMESYHIFQFQADGAKSIHFNTYELIDGEWGYLQGGGGGSLTAESGRLALTFGKLTDGARLAFQTEGQIVAANVQAAADDVAPMTFATSSLDKSRPIELEEEIPLALQIATAKNEIRSYDVDYFGMPRELAKHGYEHVYAITVTFSAQSSSEGAQATAAPPARPSPSN